MSELLYNYLLEVKCTMNEFQSFEEVEQQLADYEIQINTEIGISWLHFKIWAFLIMSSHFRQQIGTFGSKGVRIG